MSCSPIRSLIVPTLRPLEYLRKGSTCCETALKKCWQIAYITEAKKLVDWDGVSFLNGPDLRKKIEKTITQPQEVIKRIKEILKESG